MRARNIAGCLTSTGPFSLIHNSNYVETYQLLEFVSRLKVNAYFSLLDLLFESGDLLVFLITLSYTI